MLAIVTPDPSVPAETYIRQHIKKIVPGRTVVVYFHGNGIDFERIPNLKLPAPRRKNWPFILKKGYGLGAFFAYGYSSVLDDRQKNKFITFLEQNKVKAVLAEFGTVGCAIKDACKEVGVSLFVHFHGHDATVLPQRWLYRRAYRRLGKEATGIICHSRYFAERLLSLGMPESITHVIPYGIDINEFRPGEIRDPNLILAVGRFVEKKAPQLTVKAFSRVLNSVPHACLEMIGNGPLLSRCQAFSNELEISEKIIFHGAREHDFVKEKLREASIFVQHSVTAPNGDTESFGISLLEAMASGVPVVATRHNGFVETVRHGKTGYLVDEYDVKGMADKVSRILKNSKLRDEMGKSGRKWVSKNFSSHKQIRKLRKLMQIKEEAA